MGSRRSPRTRSRWAGAIEVRLVAEDPGSGWLPAVGTLERFSVGDGVRVDSGVRSGSVVSSDYDSLLAKIVAHGRSRDEARRRLRVALQRSVAAGVTTNLSTLVRLLAHPEFVGGQATTAFLGTHHDDLSGPGADPEDVTASVVAAALHSAIAHRRADRHWGFAPTGWRNLRTRGERSAWRVGDRTIELEERWIDDEFVTVLVGEWPRPTADGSLAPDERAIHEVRHAHDSSGELAIEIDGVRRAFRIEQLGSGDVLVSGSNGSTVWSPVPRFVDHDAAETGGGPVCPLPGTVIAVAVDAGQTVVEGELLMVVEAMKMEHKIVAGGPGVVGEVRYSVGDRVDAGDLLVTIVASAAGGE
ncbi:MAG: biotin/lipoyl-containing protein [Ilumatobacteraceae bacterium]